MKRCMYCGYENEDSESQCVQCGNQLAALPDGERRTISFADEPQSGDGDGNAAPVDVQENGAAVSEDAAGAQNAAAGGEGAPGQNAGNDGAGAPGQSADAAAPYAGTDGAGAAAQNTGAAVQGAGTDGAQAPAGEEWAYDVGRGQTLAARQQAEARQEQAQDGAQAPAGGYGVYGDQGYGYREGMQGESAGRENTSRAAQGGSRAFMVRSRKRVKSILFFLVALFATAMVFLNAFNILTGNAYTNISEAESLLTGVIGQPANIWIQLLVEGAAQLASLAGHVAGILDMLGDTVKLGILFIFVVPGALYCLGLWLMMIQTDTRRKQISTGGYTLARVMMIIKCIIGCLTAGIGLVVSVYFVVVGASSARYTSSMIEGIVLLVAMIIIALILVMYYAQWIFALKVAKVNARTGADPGKMPLFAAFLSIIAALLCAALMIPLPVNDYLGLAARGAAAGYFLFSGLWMIVYRIRVHA